MKAKYIITKRGDRKSVSLSDGSIILNDKTTQKDLKKLHGLGFTNLVQLQDEKEDNSNVENAID
tara:strand:+ start:8354 stop:8545 length:192 start_codon:yes stop_codon:yes gene_type:complete